MSENAAVMLTRAIDWQKRHGACAMLIAESAIDDGLSNNSHINFSLTTSFRDASKTQARNP